MKVLSTFLSLITKDSSLRLFLVSLAIGFSYQVLLSANNSSLTNFLFSNKRENIIQKNKEGIFTVIGYLCINLAGESICYTIKSILNEKYCNWFHQSKHLFLALIVSQFDVKQKVCFFVHLRNPTSRSTKSTV